MRDTILYGSGDEDVKFIYDDGMRTFETKKPFEGVINNLERRFRESESDWAREDIEKYFTSIPCKVCNGYRLKPEALCVKIGEKHIGEVAELSVRHARTLVRGIAEAADAEAERDRRPRAERSARAARPSSSMSGSII